MGAKPTTISSLAPARVLKMVAWVSRDDHDRGGRPRCDGRPGRGAPARRRLRRTWHQPDQGQGGGADHAGLGWCDSPRATAQGSDVVISMVSDDEALATVTEGADGILAGLAAGMVYVDMSTVNPQSSRALAGRVSARGAAMVAAPVSGSVPAVESGKLAIMAGGQADAFRLVEPILGQLGTRVTFVGGDVGHALLLKLAINISLAVQILAFSEGLLLAERGGLDRSVALDVLTHSAIGSPMLQTRAPLVQALPEE